MCCRICCCAGRTAGIASMMCARSSTGLRYIAKTGCQWRWMPGNLRPWAAVYHASRQKLLEGKLNELYNQNASEEDD